jgi:hypothetical protein
MFQGNAKKAARSSFDGAVGENLAKMTDCLFNMDEWEAQSL